MVSKVAIVLLLALFALVAHGQMVINVVQLPTATSTIPTCTATRCVVQAQCPGGRCGQQTNFQQTFTTDGAAAAGTGIATGNDIAPGRYLYWGNTGTFYVQPADHGQVTFPAGDTYTLQIAPSTNTGTSGQVPNTPAVTTSVSPYTFGTVSWSAADCPVAATTPPRAAVDGGPNAICAVKSITVQATTNGVGNFQATDPLLRFSVPSVFSGRPVALQWLVTCANGGGACAGALGVCGSTPGTPTNGACAAGMPASLTVSQKPVALALPGLPFAQPNAATIGGQVYNAPGFGGNLNLEVNTPSLPFTVRLANGVGGAVDPNFIPAGTSTITVTPQLWDLNTNTQTPPRVPSQVTTATFNPAVITLSAANPSASFRLVTFPNNNPFTDPTIPSTQCTGGCSNYVVYFPDPNGLAANQGASAGTSNPTWELMYFPINIAAVEVSIPNFPPVNRVLFVSPLVTTGPANAVTSTNYHYQIRMRRNPQDIATGGVVITTAVLPRLFTGTPITIFQNGVANSVFTFTGTTTVIDFQIYTQAVQTFAGTSFDIEFAVTTPSALFSTSIDISGLGEPCTIATGCTLCNPNPPTGAPTCTAARNSIARGLTIWENPIETSVRFPAGRVAPYVGEPFFFDFVWLPPLATGMTITVSGLYTAETPNSVPTNTAVPAGATSVRAGPFTPTVPPNVDPVAESFQLVYNFGLLTSGDSSWFGFSIGGTRNANVLTVTVYRRYLVSSSISRQYTGVPAVASQSVNLASTGVPSPPICISLNLPIATYVNGPTNPTLTATPIGFVNSAAARAARWDGLIFTPSVLTFTPAVQTQCFTVAYDVKFKMTPDSLSNSNNVDTAGTPPVNPWTWDVAWQLGGNLKEQFTNPWYCTAPINTINTYPYTGGCTGARIVNFPVSFVLSPNPITMWFLDGAVVAGPGAVLGQGLGPVASNWFVGESRTLVVTTDWPTPNGISYNLFAPGLTFTAITSTCTSSPASCAFAAGAAGSQTQQTHYWNVTAAISGANAIIPGWSNPNGAGQDPDNFKTGVNMEVSGADSALYALPPLIPVAIRVRRVFIDGWSNPTVAIGSSFTFNIRVGEPVLRQLIVTPTVANGNSGALTFTPASFTFVPGGPSVVQFRCTGNLLSGYNNPVVGVNPWLVRFLLSGQDQQLFWITTVTTGSITNLDNFVTVYHRPAPTIENLDNLQGTSAAPLYVGVLYGPFRASVTTPLATGESLNIVWNTNDWVFYQNGAQVSQLTFTSGENFEIFSARPLNAGQTRIFFSLTGSDAWKYASPQQYNQPGTPTSLFDRTGVPNDAADGLASFSSNAPLGRHTYLVSQRPVTVSFQAETFSNTQNTPAAITPNTVVIGTRHYGQVLINYPTAGLTITPSVRSNTATVVFSPASWTLDSVTNGTVLPFSYTVTAISQFISAPANPTAQQPLTVQQTAPINGIEIAFALSGTESTLHATPTPAQLYVVRRNFIWDVQGSSPVANYQSKTISNFVGTTGPTPNNHFVVGRRSQVFSISVTTPPVTGVTLRLAHPALTFTPALLTWNANDVVKTFTFVPNTIPPAGDLVQQFEVIVGGADAQYYDYNNLWVPLSTIQILPNLAFSPIPVTYIDQDVVGTSVQLADGLATGAFPYADDIAFSLHLYSPNPSGISFEPSALSFSRSSSMSQNYVIHHVYPNQVDFAIDKAHTLTEHWSTSPGTDSYPIGWSIKFVGTNKFIPITQTIVPQDAQRVVVARYQIIPTFPKTLGFAWQPASFNLTRAPLAHLTLVPHQPDRDGANAMFTKFTAPAATNIANAHYGSATFATGKIVTDPPAIVFNPGQTVATFQVMAIGNQVSSSYYRLDWQLSGHRDDRVCYVESGDSSPAQNGPYTFSTYHAAGASSLSVVVLLIVTFVLLLA